MTKTDKQTYAVVVAIIAVAVLLPESKELNQLKFKEQKEKEMAWR